MGSIGSASGPTLFGQTRTTLLALFYGHPQDRFYLRQLARMTGAGHGALQRELKQLTELGLVERAQQGNQVLYRANARSPIFPDLRSLIAKTVGVYDILGSALAGLGGAVEIAFVYGSVARGQERSDSDLDLMVLGDASFTDIVSALGPAQKTLGREVNPAVFSQKEFRSKLREGNHFIKSVMAGKKFFVVGTQHELANLVRK